MSALQNSDRYVSRLSEGIFNFHKKKSFSGWGTRRQWPPINPTASNPKAYVYISRRVVIRNVP